MSLLHAVLYYCAIGRLTSALQHPDQFLPFYHSTTVHKEALMCHSSKRPLRLPTSMTMSSFRHPVAEQHPDSTCHTTFSGQLHTSCHDPSHMPHILAQQSAHVIWQASWRQLHPQTPGTGQTRGLWRLATWPWPPLRSCGWRRSSAQLGALAR